MSEDRPDPDRTDLPSTEAAPSSTDQQQIGPYRLLQNLSEGGMGEVWLAVLASPKSGPVLSPNPTRPR